MLFSLAWKCVVKIFDLHEHNPYIIAKKTNVPYVVNSGHAINSKPSTDKAILLVSSTLTWKFR